jgi:hypothetical protein
MTTHVKQLCVEEYDRFDEQTIAREMNVLVVDRVPPLFALKFSKRRRQVWVQRLLTSSWKANSQQLNKNGTRRMVYLSRSHIKI